MFETTKGFFAKYFTLSDRAAFRLFRSSLFHIWPFAFPGGSTAKQR